MGGTVGVGAGTVAGIYEIQQRAAVREAERQSERLEEFASVVSHDLETRSASPRAGSERRSPTATRSTCRRSTRR